MTPDVDVYERLANALDALPHGFPRTASGVELKLIKKAFTPEEVWLAGQLTRMPETAAAIAARVGRDEADVSPLLESLIPRRLVRLDSPGMAAPGLAPTTVGAKKYRLGQFLVGWYEAMMRQEDKEFAELFEQFVDRGRGRADPIAPARRARRGPGAGLAEARRPETRTAQRHRRPLRAARALPRHPVRLQEGDGAAARAQLPQAHEALRLRRHSAADSARRDRARPGGGV